MEFLNTPDDRFENLKDYPFEANYVTLKSGMRMHYVDEGPRDAKETILLLHGEPSWSYLYRHMIKILSEHGYRCLAPDLIGFGKSSKPTSQDSYTYASHLGWVDEWFSSMNLSDVTLFCQDWGGLIGLRLVALHEDKFSRIVASNTMLPTGDHTPPEAFIRWQKFSQKVDVFPFGFLIQGATTTELSDDILDAYQAPYPDERYTAGAKIFPMLVPTSPNDPESDNNRAVWSNVLGKWQKPFLTLFGDSDPITRGGDAVMQKLIPGCNGQPHATIEGGHHFIQEDRSEVLCQHIIKWIDG